MCGLLLVGNMLGMTSAYATVTSVTASPGAANAPLGSSTSTAITWSVTTNSGTFVSSPSGTFTDFNGVVLGTNPNALYQNVTVLPGVGATVPLTEVVLVPASVIYRAYSLGDSGFLYTRTFTDSSGGGFAMSVTLNITSSALSGFSLTGMSLSFDNDAVVRVVHQKHKLSAKAVINSNGTGLLQGVWEVADPISTSAQPIYRPLLVVRQYLTGSNKQTFTSPVLPTELSGLYLVRFRVTDPVPGFEQPFLRYFVSSGKPGEAVPLLPIGLILPSPASLLMSDTMFAWEPIDGARAYQIELYARAMTDADKLPNLGEALSPTSQTLPDTPPVSGMLVAGNQTHAILSATARSHLKPGQIYLWRVLAIGEDGHVIGASSIREIRLP